MPFGSEGMSEGIGLALSGGGFRATLFHCGALWRLAELGYLGRLDRISSVSGGSITAGVLGLRWSTLRADGFALASLLEHVVTPLRAYCARNVDAPAIVGGLLVPFKSIPDFLVADYADHLFRRATLQDLPDQPRFVINSTNLATGVDFRFSKPYAGDYRIGLVERPRFPLALAVAASSAFPPVLSPVVLETDPGLLRPLDRLGPSRGRPPPRAHPADRRRRLRQPGPADGLHPPEDDPRERRRRPVRLSVGREPRLGPARAPRADGRDEAGPQPAAALAPRAVPDEAAQRRLLGNRKRPRQVPARRVPRALLDVVEVGADPHSA